MERFLSGSGCRRYEDSEMDDWQDRVWCEAEEERCDVSKKNDAIINGVDAQQAASREKESIQVKGYVVL